MFWTVTLSLLEGFWMTVKLFLLTLAFSIPLGLILGLGSMSRFKPLKSVIDVLVWIIRGTPLMLQLIVIYYGPGLIEFLGQRLLRAVYRNPRGLCHQLFVLFLRHLSRRYRSDPTRTV